MPVLVHLVADYGLGDLAFAEVAQRLASGDDTVLGAGLTDEVVLLRGG
jgi:hypothetical protein